LGMRLIGDQVKKVAKLANLPLSEEEIVKSSEQLSKILDYVDQLSNVDIKNIEPIFNVVGSSNVMSDDTPRVSLSQDEALKNASQKKNGFFITKGVFEE